MLKTESLEESLEMLSQVGMYYGPPGGRLEDAGAIVLPLPAEIGQIDIERIFNNRRFIKVYQELSEISKDMATSLIVEDINDTLAIYKQLFSESWESVFRAHENEPLEQRHTVGPSLQISDDPNGAPTLAGTRLQLLSLLLLPGIYGLSRLDLR